MKLDLQTFIDLTRALTPLAWPAIAVLLLWMFRGPIVAVVESREFEVEVAGFKVSVGTSIRTLNRQLGDLKSRLAEIETAPQLALFAPPDESGEGGDGGGGEPIPVPVGPWSFAVGGAPAPPPSPTLAARRDTRILWVDDAPEGNAFEIEQLRQDGMHVDLATSTEEGIRALLDARKPYDLVLSDMGRTEDGGYRPRAGIDLLERARESELDTPFVFFTAVGTASSGEVQRRLATHGGAWVTGSTADLFTLVSRATRVSHAGGGEGSG